MITSLSLSCTSSVENGGDFGEMTEEEEEEEVLAD
jgi:hypothetical protein